MIRFLPFLVSSLLLLSLSSAHAQGKDSLIDKSVIVRKLTERIWVLTCVGGPEFGQPAFGMNTVASVGEDGILLADSGFDSTGAALREKLKELGNSKLKIIINTHYHGEHTLGNKYLREGVITAAHRNAVANLSGSYYHLSGAPRPERPLIGS